MEVILKDGGKKFVQDWIFRHFNLHLYPGKAYAVIGPNGSGKSTFLQTIAGILPLSEGCISYLHQRQAIPASTVFRLTALTAPYLELIEELSLTEFLHFHQQFKPFAPALTASAFMDKTWLTPAKNKPLRHFSSGMKQRLKLGLALFSGAPLLLLDEPTANLDREGMNWYQQQLQSVPPDTLLLIASNEPEEYSLLNPELIRLVYV
jgi:ABC-type multidrug transport system ATPase subunit